MKRILFSFLLCVGFYTGAEQLQDAASQPSVASGVGTAASQPSVASGVGTAASQPSVASGASAAASQPSVASGVSATVSQPSVASGVSATVSQPSVASGATNTAASQPSVASGVSATVSKPNNVASGTDPAVFQMSEVGVVKPKRNGFFSATLNFNYAFTVNQSVFGITTDYGQVLGHSNIAPAGTFETAVSVSGAFSRGVSQISVGGTGEVNFIKNDGINKLVPGLAIGVSLGYKGSASINGFFSITGGNLYLKSFISNQFALVPYLGATYVYGSADIGTSSGTATGFLLNVGLGLRNYF